ncbi:hypothetical protein GQX74_001045, partial [Glossina fuscipes]
MNWQEADSRGYQPQAKNSLWPPVTDPSFQFLEHHSKCVEQYLQLDVIQYRFIDFFYYFWCNRLNNKTKTFSVETVSMRPKLPVITLSHNNMPYRTFTLRPQ